MPIAQRAIAEKPKIKKMAIPNSDDIVAAAKSSVASAPALVELSIRRPRPRSPLRKKKSPTIAPMTQPPAAIRRPVKIAGIALGSSSFHRRVQRLAPLRRNSSC